MKAWQLKVDVDRYAPLAFVDPTMTRRLLGEFMGSPFSGKWGRVEVYSPKEWEEPGLSRQEREAIKDLKEGRRLGDFVWLAGAEAAVVMSDLAMKTLQSLIEDSAEIRPLHWHNEILHLVNVVKVIDCLDEDRSDLSRLRNGSILRVIHPVFKEGLLGSAHIFKLPQPKIDIFVSDLFKYKVEASRLTGLVWE